MKIDYVGDGLYACCKTMFLQDTLDWVLSCEMAVVAIYTTPKIDGPGSSVDSR